ncbi:helix-turn-helix domain-containing protein [Frankia sp. CiP3]|uniref:helix-turn-helix domain-containing protein n=1 Tax=Frankia sp. CiP3 TaxID=2880971 RepID=UPI001EF6CD56|nr:helix-turn-helix domain-containing protein [Frankia sp. CiP3]
MDQGLDLVEAVYRGRPVDPKAQYLPAEIVDSLGAPASQEADVFQEAEHSEVARALAAARRLGAEAEAARQQMMAGARARRAAILDAHRAGMSVRKIAVELGCSPAVLQDAIRTARGETAVPDGRGS